MASVFEGSKILEKEEKFKKAGGGGSERENKRKGNCYRKVVQRKILIKS